MKENLTPVAWLPLAVFLEMGTTLIITQTYVVCFSDTGACPPESCIFGQFLNIAAVLMGWTSYVRYRQVALLLNGDSSWYLPKANHVGFWLGVLAATGLSIVGNFQETNVATVHLTGALMAFASGTVYSWIQVAVSYLTDMKPRKMAHARAFLSACITLSFILYLIFHSQVKAPRFTRGDNSTLPECNSDIKPSYPSTMRMLCALFEWLMAANVLAFYMTFYGEFKEVRMTWQKITVFSNVKEATKMM